MSDTIPAHVIGELREAVVGLRRSRIEQEIVAPQEAVLKRWQPFFAPDATANITAEEFCKFLLIDNNHHWTGLHRHGGHMTEDMDKLREAIALLSDETISIADRLDQGPDKVHGMGRNIATAILLILFPDKCGVWNTRSHENMKRLGILPEFDRGDSFGKRYVKVNDLLLELSDELGVDLWTLDSLWYYIDERDKEGNSDPSPTETDETLPGEEPSESEQRFGLERHLHNFLRDNWDRIELGKDWEIYSEPGEDEAGYEYKCDVGRIDLLVKHRKDPKWLVIELKRNQTSDETVGQLTRYMGWVTENLAEGDEQVHGMIICHVADDSLRYALSVVPNTELRLYKVDFALSQPETVPTVDGSDSK